MVKNIYPHQRFAASTPSHASDWGFALGAISQMIEIAASPLHGCGLFASLAFAKGQVIVEEAPLVAMQDLASRAEVMCCGKCLAPLPINDSLRKELASGVRTRQETYESLKRAGFGPEVVPCPSGCGELYCCETCRLEHESHGLLCVGGVSEADADTHPLVEFKRLAVESNEILLLAAEVVTSVKKNRFAGFVNERWDDVIRRAASLRGEAPDEALCASLRDLVDHAAQLLSRAIGGVVSPETLSRALGMFELNNIGIRRQVGLSCIEGTALYEVCCRANHSCDPSCHVLYDGPSHKRVLARLVARRDIAAGEELTICYVDESADTAARRWATAEYGFLCRCSRCEAGDDGDSDEMDDIDDDI